LYVPDPLIGGRWRLDVFFQKEKREKRGSEPMIREGVDYTRKDASIETSTKKRRPPGSGGKSSRRGNVACGPAKEGEKEKKKTPVEILCGLLDEGRIAKTTNA